MEKTRFGQYHAAFLLVSGLFVFWTGCSMPNARPGAAKQRSRSSFDKAWHFKLYEPGTDDSAQGLEKSDYDDSGWRTLNLPHDWAVEGGFDLDLPGNTGKLPSPGLGWYRKHFMVPESDQGKRIFIDFDGAMSHAKVWLNGDYVGQWPYGYASFRLELTDHIQFGQENVLAVRLDNPPDASRWYPGGGIYRHTWLVKTKPVHIAHWGTSVTTPEVSKETATIQIQTEIQNQSAVDTVIAVRQQILKKNTLTPVASIETAPLTVAAGQTETCSQAIVIPKPVLWDIENPYLYTARTIVSRDGKIVDVYDTPFGIRTAQFDAKQGFLLNGKHLYLKGVCLHHDMGPLGAAIHRRAIERQLEVLKEMGCNAIRTSHNPPTPELLELCDQMGFVVIDEAFDCWEKRKTKNDYGTLFDQWHEKDIAAMVHRDRNHPCVILWSSGNEILEQGAGEQGRDISRMLTSLFHREDPTRPVTAGCNWPDSAWNGFADTVDVYGFNYKPQLYKEFSQRRPDQPFYSSESSSTLSSRGEYFFPVSEDREGGFFNYQVNSYDLYYPGWATTSDAEFEGQDKHPACAGEFVWTGFDYLGEPTPYNKDETVALNYHTEAEKKAFEEQLAKMDGKSPSRSSYFGIVDLCGFPKDRFYLYQARWRPEVPMAHILPHWNWPERVGEVTPVHVYTSGDEAELFLNGKSLGRKKKLSVDEKAKPNGNLAVGKSVTCSSAETDRSNDAPNAVDNDLTNRWCASSAAADQWWQVDLGLVKPLKSCVIYWEKDAGQYAYRLKVSTDAQQWKTVAEKSFEGSNPYSVLTFDEPGRYVRVEFTGLKNGVWASFYEFQVFDTASPTIQGTHNPLFDRYRLRWNDVVYEPGQLKVVAYKDGKKWAKDVMETTDQPAALKLVADRTKISADGRDLSYLTVQVVDNEGRMVPRSHPKITFSIEGPGKIAATGNGDATDLTSFLSTERNAYNGLCLAIVQSLDGQAGRIRVTVAAEGLEADTVTIRSR